MSTEYTTRHADNRFNLSLLDGSSVQTKVLLSSRDDHTSGVALGVVTGLGYPSI